MSLHARYMYYHTTCTHIRVHRPLHFHALRLIPTHSCAYNVRREHTYANEHAYIRNCICIRIRTYTRWGSPHKLTSLSRDARLLLAPRIARLHNSGGRSARFSSARELLTFPGFGSLRFNVYPRDDEKNFFIFRNFNMPFYSKATF